MSDLISRQAAIAVADSSDCVGLSIKDVKKVTDEVVKGLKRLPSVQPTVDTVKHGEWISEKYPLVKCSECGKTMILAYDNFCPNCGAKMDGKEKDDETDRR